MAQPQMIRPEALDKLPYLDEGTKTTYKNGLSNLWKQYESSPPAVSYTHLTLPTKRIV